MTDTKKYIMATGRRKTAVASVRLSPASQPSFVVNGMPAEEYFKTRERLSLAKSPFTVIDQDAHYAIEVRVTGGGISAQAEAVRHGIARALVKNAEELRTPLKKASFLTRDARAVERKKPGLKKARKAPQWSKR